MTAKLPKKSPYPKDELRVKKSFTLDPEILKKLEAVGHNASKNLEAILREYFARKEDPAKFIG